MGRGFLLLLASALLAPGCVRFIDDRPVDGNVRTDSADTASADVARDSSEGANDLAASRDGGDALPAGEGVSVPDAGETDAVCPAPLKLCASACADVQIDLNNCGACGNVCGSSADRCVGGVCLCGNALGACADGLDCAAGDCSCVKEGSCAGCCMGSQQCMPGNSPEHCGNGGSACVTCPASTECKASSCANNFCQLVYAVDGKVCNDGVCAGGDCCTGCVDGSGKCLAGLEPSACGVGGNKCVACPPSASPCIVAVCSGGQCAYAVLADEAPCTDISGIGRCRDGICCTGCWSQGVSSGTCLEGTEKNACGAAGVLCAKCEATDSCNEGKCVAP